MATAPSNTLAEGGMHSLVNGTSFSSPAVTGIVALYFQKYPDATWQDVKDALINTALQDNFTDTVPNSSWGYGKANAFRALLEEPAPPVVRVNEGALFVNNAIEVFPNPAQDYVNIRYRLNRETNNSRVHLKLVNLLGEELLTLEIKNMQDVILLPLNGMPTGMYFINLIDNQKMIDTKKLVHY